MPSAGPSKFIETSDDRLIVSNIVYITMGSYAACLLLWSLISFGRDVPNKKSQAYKELTNDSSSGGDEIVLGSSVEDSTTSNTGSSSRSVSASASVKVKPGLSSRRGDSRIIAVDTDEARDVGASEASEGSSREVHVAEQLSLPPSRKELSPRSLEEGRQGAQLGDEASPRACLGELHRELGQTELVSEFSGPIIVASLSGIPSLRERLTPGGLTESFRDKSTKDMANNKLARQNAKMLLKGASVMQSQSFIDVQVAVKPLRIEAFDGAVPAMILAAKVSCGHVLKELYVYHRWLSPAAHFSQNSWRVVRVIGLGAYVLGMLFCDSVIYLVTEPDDGSCEGFRNIHSCTRERSSIVDGESKCFWVESNNSCYFREAETSLVFLVVVALIASVCSILASKSLEALLLLKLNLGRLSREADAQRNRRHLSVKDESVSGKVNSLPDSAPAASLVSGSAADGAAGLIEASTTSKKQAAAEQSLSRADSDAAVQRIKSSHRFLSRKESERSRDVSPARQLRRSETPVVLDRLSSAVYDLAIATSFREAQELSETLVNAMPTESEVELLLMLLKETIDSTYDSIDRDSLKSKTAHVHAYTYAYKDLYVL